MVEIIIGSVLIVIALLALTLQRFYSSIPLKELKRLAGSGDYLAVGLHRPATYGPALRLFLWVITGLALAGGLALLGTNIHPGLSFLVMVILFSLTFVWLPSLKLTLRAARFAMWFAPAISWAVGHIYAPLEMIHRLISTKRHLSSHSHLYEQEDFHDLIKQQKEQSDNRISPRALDLIEHALTFTTKQAADIVKPRKEAYLVNADDTIGPILLDQLHKHKQTSFLAYRESKDNIIGSISMQDAVQARQGGRVLDLVRGDLTFVHEDYSLSEVAQAFQQTGNQLVVVINSFEEFIGTITLESLLSELFGSEEEQIALVANDNRSAVASFKRAGALPEEQNATTTQTEDKDNTELLGSSPEATEVVE